MSRGLGGRPPAILAHYSKRAQALATKDARIRQAIKDGGDAAVIGLLEAFPDEKFKTLTDVMRSYGRPGLDRVSASK